MNLKPLVLIVSGIVLAGVLGWGILRQPVINDIVTDFNEIPQFRYLKVKDHGGDAVLKIQRAAYPGITALQLDLPLLVVFEKALGIAKNEGWQIVYSDPATGRIEATAQSRLFRFKDDVLILMSLVPSGTQIDMRSLSRVGKSDLGANAKRIQSFFKKLATP